MTAGTIIDIKADTIGVVVPAEPQGAMLIDNTIISYEMIIPLPPGNWKVVCTSLTMTEEEAHKLVENYSIAFGTGELKDVTVKTANVFPNHMNPYSSNPKEAFVKTALESFRTLIEHKTGEYLHTNPFGEKEPVYSKWYSNYDVIDNDGVIHRHGDNVFKKEREQWREAQAKVIPQLLILIKE